MRKTTAWLRIAAAVVAGIALGAGQARAAAINLTSPGIEFDSDFFTLGFEFTVNTPMSLNALGVYDSGKDGLAAPANVGLWLNNGALLTSTVVPSGSGGGLDGFFRYAAVAPISLAPGVHYVVGSFLTGDLASSFNTGQGGAATVDPHVTIVMDRFSPFDSAFGFPNASNFFVGGAWLGANFQANPVPEPATLTLFGLGLVVLRAARRRKI